MAIELPAEAWDFADGDDCNEERRSAIETIAEKEAEIIIQQARYAAETATAEPRFQFETAQLELKKAEAEARADAEKLKIETEFKTQEARIKGDVEKSVSKDQLEQARFNRTADTAIAKARFQWLKYLVWLALIGAVTYVSLNKEGPVVSFTNPCK